MPVCSRSEAYFRSVVQSAGDAVVILDDDLQIKAGPRRFSSARWARPPPSSWAVRSWTRCTRTTSSRSPVHCRTATAPG